MSLGAAREGVSDAGSGPWEEGELQCPSNREGLGAGQ